MTISSSMLFRSLRVPVDCQWTDWTGLGSKVLHTVYDKLANPSPDDPYEADIAAVRFELGPLLFGSQLMLTCNPINPAATEE